LPNIIVTRIKPDCVTLDDSNTTARALMPCGHAIGPESMVHLLQTLIKSGKYIIRCPGSNSQGKACNTVWPFDLCKVVGILSRDEKYIIEEGLAQNNAKNGDFKSE